MAKKQKTPAAAGKTSTKLTQVQNTQERFSSRKKKACGSREDLNEANTGPKIIGTPFGPTKNACGSQEDLNKANTGPKILGTPF